MKGAARKNSGQAMVEFVILLILVFIPLLAGMLYVSRLLVYDFWAQQEARFLAFEQVDAPESAYANPKVDPATALGDSNAFKRFRYLEQLGNSRNVTDDSDVRDLLSSLRSEEEILPAAVTVSPQGGFPFVESAYARGVIEGDSEFDPIPAPKDVGENRSVFSPRPGLEQAVSHLINERTNFGESFCAAMSRGLGVAGHHGARQIFSDPSCAKHWGTGFGTHLARATDIKGLSREFSERMKSSFTTGEALQTAVDSAVAEGFYSFYDTAVAAAIIPAIAVGVLGSERATALGEINGDEQIERLTSELRYVGSLIAVGAVRLAGVTLNFHNIFSQDSKAELDFEKTITDILHADAKGPGGVGFYLGPEYLPLTTLMLEPMYGGLMNGVMRNILSKDDDLEDEIIDASNKEVVVDYTVGGVGAGLFPAAVRLFNTTGKKLTGRYYLVTQPWQIPRRESPNGDYRDLGNEDNDADTPTDEGILRRRTIGLWLFPTDIPALLQPIVDLIPGGGALGDIFSGNFVFDGIDLLAGAAKDFICDNPLSDLIGMLEDIPFVSGDWSFPKCPAVRPAAYPHSEEITGDRSTGQSRNFSDFVEEQKNANPRARPEYHEDSDNAGNDGGQSDQGYEECNWRGGGSA